MLLSAFCGIDPYNRDLRWLENDTVASEQCRNHFTHGKENGKIPRADTSDHANGYISGDDFCVLIVRADNIRDVESHYQRK